MPLRILLITPKFYGIEKIIKSVLQESNFEVTWLENKILPFDYHGTNSKLKLLRRIYFFLLSPYIRYLKRELKKIENPEFDVLFSINAHVICPYLFRRLKSKNPRLSSVLYLWDAFAKYDFTKELSHFDEVYTFDPADSIKYNLKYRPNFYVKSNIRTNHEMKYDLFFAGKFSPFRLDYVDKVVNKAETLGVNYFIRLSRADKTLTHNHLIYWLLKKFSFNNTWIKNYKLNYEAVESIIVRKFLVSETIGYEEMQKYSLCSNVILDLPFEEQTGYTHRLIEALANGKKIITTNSNIREEIFYNSEQIHIMNKQTAILDCKWIKEKSTFPVNSYFMDLELSVWLKSIINVGFA